MKNIKKWFTSQKMTWKKVIILALSSAVITAIVMLIKYLTDTSFQDIGINLDCWILFAVFIIINCQNWKEAAVKTFVFFLISQPLIYLIQVPFSRMGFGIFQYYEYWFKVTILTIPGSVIAYQLKRKDWLSVAVLSVATAFLGYMAANYFWAVKAVFPHHLISMCLCICLAIFFIDTLLQEKIHKIVAVIVIIISIVVSLILCKPVTKAEYQLGEGNWKYDNEYPEVISFVIDDNNKIIFTAEGEGTVVITFTNESGQEIVIVATVLGGGIFISTID